MQVASLNLDTCTPGVYVRVVLAVLGSPRTLDDLSIIYVIGINFGFVNPKLVAS
jgi:hypothetical protein